MLFYRAALPLSRQTLTFVSGIIRRHQISIGSPWRKLNSGQPPGKGVILSWDTPAPNAPHDVMQPAAGDMQSSEAHRLAMGMNSGPPVTEPSREEPDPSAERLAYSVDEAARLTGLSRDLLYDQMRRGNLRYVKIGRRRLITRRHLEQFLGVAS